MSRKPLLALYALAHFWVDLSCAFLMYRTVTSSAQLVLCLLLYNFCAFALQMPLGLLADHLDRNGTVAALGCLLVAGACLSPAPLLTALTAGLGNALFHLGGGIDTLNFSGRKAAALGIFVSPGALGLCIGALWGKGTRVPIGLIPAVLLLLSAAILLLARRTLGSARSGNAPLALSGDWGRLLPLFLVVVLRSYVGMNQSFDWRSTGIWSWVLTAALVLGKAAGGFLMDRTGPRRAALLSLIPASALYLLSQLPWAGTLAVFLFNMTMPITLWAAAQALPGAKGFAFGSLTFALFLGFLPSWLGWSSLLTGGWSYAAAALFSLLLLLLAFRDGPKARTCLTKEGAL